MNIVPNGTDYDPTIITKILHYSKKSIELAIENKDAISRIEVILQDLVKTQSSIDEDSDLDVDPIKIYTRAKQTKKWYLVSWKFIYLAYCISF